MKETKEKNYFEKLNAINVNEHTEKKEGLTYLTWSWAWGELLKIYPNATYEIVRFGENQLPYVYDENLGYMVFTNMTIEGITHEMWLPVMDSKNKAMKDKPYTYTTKYGDKQVEQASMFDVNKTLMRCLVKNIAMFGLGLYIYAGEDLPETPKEESKKYEEMTTKEKIKTYKNAIDVIKSTYNIKLSELSEEEQLVVLNKLEESK